MSPRAISRRLHVAGFAMTPPGACAPFRASAGGWKPDTSSRSTIRSSARRFSEDEIEYWRDWGLFYFVPCVAKEGTIAVLALGRNESAEPLSSEDMALIGAVAGQAATALENGRLYRQLHVKAGELDRLREFSENVLQSLDDGLVVADPDGRILWWNRAIEEAVRRRRRPRRSAASLADCLRHALRRSGDGRAARAPGGRDALPRAARVAPRRRRPAAAQRHGGAAAPASRRRRRRRCGSVLLFEDISARVQLEEQLQVSEKMASIGLLAAGVAHEVNTPLTGIASFTQMLLEGANPEDPRTKPAREDRAPDVPRREDRQWPAEPLAPDRPADGGSCAGRHQRRRERRGSACSNTSSRPARSRSAASCPSQAPVVDGVEYKLQQVFLNLFLNARDAMPRGGWLSVSTKIESRCGGHRSGRHRLRHPERAPGANLRSVLHDQVHRAGHRSRAVDCIRHRP